MGSSAASGLSVPFLLRGGGGGGPQRPRTEPKVLSHLGPPNCSLRSGGCLGLRGPTPLCLGKAVPISPRFPGVGLQGVPAGP